MLIYKLSGFCWRHNEKIFGSCVQGITLSAGGVFSYVRSRAGAKRKPPHTAKIFVPEAKDGKLGRIMLIMSLNQNG